MKLTLCFFAILLGTACSTQAQKPALSAPNMVQASRVEGLSIKHRGVDMTVLGNVSIQRLSGSEVANAQSTAGDPSILGHIGPVRIWRTKAAASPAVANSTATEVGNQVGIRSAAPTALSNDAAFVGVIYQNDSQELGLIGKEITLRFKGGAVPSSYAGWAIKELIPNAKIYLLTVKDLNEWLTLLPKLEADPQVTLVEAHIVTDFKRPH